MNKKHLFFAAALALSMSAEAQNSKVISTWNYLNYYNNGEGAENLEKAKAAIDEASMNEATMASGKTWWYRIQVHQYILLDTVMGPKFPTALSDAMASYKKLNELNDTRFKDWSDVMKNLSIFGNIAFNAGVDQFKSAKYDAAYESFYMVKEVNTLLSARGGKVSIESGTALSNAAMAAENAGKPDAAIGIYKELIATTPDAKYYRLLAAAYKKAEKMDDYRMTLDEGIAKYPQNIDLKIDMLNLYIAEDKHDQAIGMMKDAMALDPKNDQLPYALGTAYDKLGRDEDAKGAYLKAIELNPKSFNAYYNLGALYFNKGGKLNDKMNELGYSKDDQTKYADLKKQRAVLFAQAKPYFEKAKEIDPQDQAVNKALKQIDLYTNQQ